MERARIHGGVSLEFMLGEQRGQYRELVRVKASWCDRWSFSYLTGLFEQVECARHCTEDTNMIETAVVRKIHK